MLGWLRARARLVAPLVLVALGTLALPHGGEAGHDRDDGLPTIVVHDASDHHVTTLPRSESEHPDHCAICHWTRTFRAQTRVGLLASASTARVHRSPGREAAPAFSSAAPQPPLRAPPLSPAFA